jgi:hypothetical protein
MNLFIRLFVVGSVLLSVTAASLFGQATHKLDPSTFDQSVEACTDFYQYVLGNFNVRVNFRTAYPKRLIFHELSETVSNTV